MALRSRISLFACAALLSFAASAQYATDYKSIPAGTPCPPNHAVVSYDDAVKNNWMICQRMGAWDIARLEGRASISGTGYNCKVLENDARQLGATICKAAANQAPAPAGCRQKGCGITERGYNPRAQGNERVHDCTGLVTASIRQQCEARNAAATPAVKASCLVGPDRLAGKGYAECLRKKLPALPDSLRFGPREESECTRDLRTFCTQTAPIDWLIARPQGFYENCTTEARPQHCQAQMRLAFLCGEFTDAFYREECLVRARK